MEYDKQKIKEIEIFLKEAFCVDGECNYKKFDTLVSQKDGITEKVMTFILTDTERGTFKVCLSK